MSLLLGASIVEAIFILLLSLTVLKSDSKKTINRVFFVFAVLLALWSLFVSVSSSVPSVLIARLVDVFGLLACMFLVVFSSVYPDNAQKKISKCLMWVHASLMMLFSPVILLTPFIVKSVTYSDGITLPVGGTISWLFFSLIFIQILIGVGMIVYKYFWIYKHNALKRRQMVYVVFGIAFSATATLVAFIPYLINSNNTFLIDNAVPLIAVIFVVFISYGILKGGLFDVRTAIVRSVTYSLVLATMAGIYVATTSVFSTLLGFGQSSWAELFGNIAISLVLVFIFQPIKRFFDKITNKIFYKDNYNSDEFFARLNKTLALTTDLRGLLERTANEIGKTLKSSQTFFFINTDDQHFMTAGTKNHAQLQKHTADQFAAVPKGKNGVLVASLLDESDPTKTALSEHKIEIVLPLIQDGKVVGLLCLGEHLSSNYTNRDIQVLDTISNELIIAIQNALSVQEIRDFNVTLKREIANATQELRVKNALLKKLDKAKDEFVSMASHQLRTPLTSVKGYLSMVIEGDAGKVSTNQKELLDQAFESNEKMVHLVNDFLNVSRIQTGKFMLDKIPTDLSKLVTSEIDGLRQNAKARNLNLVLTVPKQLPMLNIDEGKIRQVVMNFADNALYYSNANTDININLAVDGDEVVYTVRDTGIGVPISEQGQLFTKFYRASNARKQRPDGTGVGLYLAKKIITAHDGKIVFETVEGKGSTFGFRLPIKELEVSSDDAYNLKE